MVHMHDQGRKQAVNTACTAQLHAGPRKVSNAYMKAGVKRSSSCACKFSMIEVIMPAAWKAIFREGYAASSGYSCREALLCEAAGGICAL